MDFLKCKVRGESIKFASRKKKSQNNQLQVLEKKVKMLQYKIDNKKAGNMEDRLFSLKDDEKELENVKEEISKIQDIKTKGTMIRARTEWYLYGEKPTSYFLKLEQRNYFSKNRFSLQRKVHY